MSDEQAIVVEARNLSKVYQQCRTPLERLLYATGLSGVALSGRRKRQELWALRQVNLTIKRGERVGIIGRNGAGKSTLLKIVAGTVSPTIGTIVAKGRIRALLELGIGFHPELTGRENIGAALAYQQVQRNAEDLEREIIQFAELGDAIDQQLRTYSSGMFTRLAFSVATAVRPELLVVDEILATGDAYFVGKCFERIQQLSDEHGVAVLMASHDLGAIQALCHRVIWLERGIVKAEGAALDVLRDYARSVRQDEEARLREKSAVPRVGSSQGSNGSGSGGEFTHEYGSREVVVTGVTVNVGDSYDVRTLVSLRPFEFVIAWKAQEIVEDPVFVLCVYLTSGRCACQWIASSKQLGQDRLSGTGTVVFRGDRLLLGAGHYVASIGIFHERPDRGHEAKAYHVLDRSLYLQVVNEDAMDLTDHGICRQPATVELLQRG